MIIIIPNSKASDQPLKIEGILSSQLFVLLPEFVDPINHLLNQLNLRVTKPVLVRNVISVTSLTSRLSASSTRLKVKLLTSCFELLNTMVGPAGKVDMDRSSHSSTEV